MKFNKTLTTLTVAAMLASCGAVYAADGNLNEPAQPDTPFEDNIQGDIMLISSNPNNTANTPSYIKNDVTVTNIEGDLIESSIYNSDAENPENTIKYLITKNTMVFDEDGNKKSAEDVKKDSVLTVFSDSYAPAPLILPPQYSADIIIIKDTEKSEPVSIDADTYIKNEDRLTNAANTLVLNIGEEAVITDLDGKEVKEEELENKDLLVFYTISTRSIPAQTNPHKIIVLGENETALNNIKNNGENTPIDYTAVSSVKVGDKELTNVYAEDGILMVPLRAAAEALGMTVDWDGDTNSVYINGGIYSLKIGENSYIKGRMTPIELGCAPVLKNDLTYVPIEYFTEVQECSAEINGTILTLN